ncbi:hypothetical protein AAKU67_001890 [Oxalobacteraceae bacterium GrIS 2.11]
MKITKRIIIWKGCDERIISAVEQFSDRFGPYSAKSRQHSLFSLFEELVQPAWTDYLEALPIGNPYREKFEGISLIMIARMCGFRELEDFLVRNFPNNCDSTFAATLETMRELASECHRKRPRKLETGRKDRKHSIYCALCGAHTELYDIRQGQNQTTYDPEAGRARFSAKYCWNHRPKRLDKTRNPTYQFANRSKATFDVEALRLMRQFSSFQELRSESGNADVDLFYLRLVRIYSTYTDVESTLRNEARLLTDLHIDDRIKRIIMLRAKGLTLDAIAIEVGMKSRQAVFKALSSVPIEYRFDLSKSPMNKADLPSAKSNSPGSVALLKLQEEFGQEITAALNDPQIYTIYLNDDGKLFFMTAESEYTFSGIIQPNQANKLMKFIAKTLGTTPSNEDPFISGHLPFYRASFEGVLPPVAENPCFVIQKRLT